MGNIKTILAAKDAETNSFFTEKHAHNRELWFGISGDQSGNDWAADTLNPFQAISGNGVYGIDLNDEAKVLGTDDTPIITGQKRFDIKRILLEDTSVDTIWKLRIVYGSDTLANNISAGRFVEMMALFDSTNPQQSAGTPIEFILPKLNAGVDKVWIEGRNATDNATIDFFVGVHGYVR